MFWLKPEYLEPRWSFRVKMHFLYFEFGIEPSREQYDEVKAALELVRTDFLQWSHPRSWMANREIMPRLRGLLQDAGCNAPNMWDDEWVVHAVHHEVRLGNLIFAPPRERLEEYIRQVRNERQRRAHARAAPALTQPTQQPSNATTPSQLHLQRVSRVPRDTRSWSSGESDFDVWDAPDDPVSTPLGDAESFEYSEDMSVGDADQEAGVFLTPAEEAECEIQLNADMDECSAWYAAKPSSWGTCRERAMQRYANCLRGRSID
ncbi:hypothetical protein VSR68_28080 [Paraburkholderia phymatum]|uniref:hypothetical protein n=1 Tax=Paraburkholderia phymatum TaxID=148447 RepID=UPI00317BB71E